MELNEIKNGLNAYKQFYRKQLAEKIRALMGTAKENGYTDEDLAMLLQISVDKVKRMQCDDWDGRGIGINTLCMIFLLSNGEFKLGDLTMCELDKSTIRGLVSDAIEQTHPSPTKPTRNEMIGMILDKFGAHTDDELFQLFQTISQVVENREKKVQEENADEMDNDTRACRINISKDENGDGKISASVWDGQDKKDFNLPLNEENVAKFLNFLGW